MGEQTFGDMSDEFVFDEQGMDYVDGPLSGWLQRKRDGAWFACECQPVIADKLWHWTLVPVPSMELDIQRVLSAAAGAKTGSWLSITEDRRASTTSICRLVEIANSAALPVLGSVKGRVR